MKVENKTSKPDNIVKNESDIKSECQKIESDLPDFLYDYFIYLRSAVSINTRLAYLLDIRFFLIYIIEKTKISNKKNIKELDVSDFSNISARDVNRYLAGYCMHYEEKNSKGEIVVVENGNRALSRKKSAISQMFKFLFRDGVLEKDISTGFNPIKLPKPQPDAIKRLEIEEVNLMMQTVSTGSGLTKREYEFWEKTRYRDKAILVMFTTYGLRLKELWQLNLSSISFEKKEFEIYRKRGKQVKMPLNNSAINVLKDYIDIERPSDKELIDSEKDALFLSLQNKRMTERAIRNLVKKYTSVALKTSRNKGYSPHKLRATTASSLIEYGFSIFDVQNLMDHDNVTTTQLYAQHKKQAKKDIIDNYELLDEE